MTLKIADKTESVVCRRSFRSSIPIPPSGKDARALARTNQFSYSHVSPLAVLKDVPFDNAFSFEWLKASMHYGLAAMKNRAELEKHDKWAAELLTKAMWVEQVLGLMPTEAFGFLTDLVTHMLRFEGRKSAPTYWATSIEDFNALFQTIGLPPVSAKIGCDVHFAEVRLAGPNPVMIKQIRARRSHAPLRGRVCPGDARRFAGRGGGRGEAVFARLRRARTHGRFMRGFARRKKYLYAPIASSRSTEKLASCARSRSSASKRPDPIIPCSPRRTATTG